MVNTFARASLVALIATIASGMPMVTLLVWGMDPELRLGASLNLMMVAALGNFLIGLPVSLLAYWLIPNRTDLSFFKLVAVANLVAGILLMLLLITAGEFGLIFFGLPIVIAVNAFAIAGWIVVVKPSRTCGRGYP